MRSRILVAVCVVGLMAIGTGGVIAAGGGNSHGNSASKSEYKPGYGPCKSGGVNPSGTHTGPPGRPGQNCQTKASSKSSSSACARQRFTVRVRGARLRNARVIVAGRSVAVRNGKASVPVTDRMTGRVRIRVAGVSRLGRRVRGSRTYSPCQNRRSPNVKVKRAR